MKKLMTVLFIILLHCPEKESKNNGTPDPAHDDPRNKDFILSGSELKYNEKMYYYKYFQESESSVQVTDIQIKNYEKEILVFLPFADQFRQDILKNDPKEIIKYFSKAKKQKILRYLNEEYCLSFSLNELTAENLVMLYGQGKLKLKETVNYFYSGLTERKAPLVLDATAFKWTKEEMYLVMIAPKWPHTDTDAVFFFKKNSAGAFELEEYGRLNSGGNIRYYSDSPLKEFSPDDRGHPLLPQRSACDGKRGQ